MSHLLQEISLIIFVKKVGKCSRTKVTDVSLTHTKHYYRMDLLSRAVTTFSPGYRAGTMIPRLKVPPLVPGHRAGAKEGPLVPVGVTNRAFF